MDSEEDAKIVDLEVKPEIHDSHDIHYVGDGVTRACVICHICVCHSKGILSIPCIPFKAA